MKMSASDVATGTHGLQTSAREIYRRIVQYIIGITAR